MLIAIQADRKFYGNEYYEIQMTIVNIFKFIVPLVKVVQLFMPLVDSHFTSMHNFGERDWNERTILNYSQTKIEDGYIVTALRAS